MRDDRNYFELTGPADDLARKAEIDAAKQREDERIRAMVRDGKATRIGVVEGRTYYENPLYGDEEPLVVVEADGTIIIDSGEWDLP